MWGFTNLPFINSNNPNWIQPQILQIRNNLIRLLSYIVDLESSCPSVDDNPTRRRIYNIHDLTLIHLRIFNSLPEKDELYAVGELWDSTPFSSSENVD